MDQLTTLDIAGLTNKVLRYINTDFKPLAFKPYKDTIPTYDEKFALNYLYYYAPRTFAEVKFILNDLLEYKLLPNFSFMEKTRILDLGCGSGSGSLAVMDFLSNELGLNEKPVFVYLADNSSHQLEIAYRFHKICGMGGNLKPKELDIFHEVLDYSKRIGSFNVIILSKALNEFISKAKEYQKKSEAEEFLSSYIGNIFDTFLDNNGIMIVLETAEYSKKTASFGYINLRRTFNKIIFNTMASKFIILPRICAARLGRHCGEALKNCDWWRHEEITFRNSIEDLKFIYYCFFKNKKEIKKPHSYVMYGGKRKPQYNKNGEQLVCSIESFGYK